MGSFIALPRAWAVWTTLLLLTACRAEPWRGRRELTSVRKDRTRATQYDLVLVWAIWPDSCLRVGTEKLLAEALEDRGVEAGLASAHITLQLTLEDTAALGPVVRASAHDYEAVLFLFVFDLDTRLDMRTESLGYLALLGDYSDGKELWRAYGVVEGPDAVAREVPRIVEAMVKDGLIR